MQFHFSEFNKAINYTLEFYGIERIKDYLLSRVDDIKPKEPIRSNNSWYDTVLKLHDYMGQEIAQNMVLYNDIGKAYFFGLLKDWLTDYRIMKVDVATLEKAIEIYNEKVYEEYLIKQEEKEKIFKETEDYKKYKHLEVIERKMSSGVGLWGRGIPNVEFTVPETYHRFITAYTPVLINIDYLPQYITLVKELIENFKRIINYHLDKYEEIKGKILPNSQLLLPVPKELEQLRTPDYIPQRIKVKLTVEQLTFLFRLLKDCNIIEAKHDNQIHEFLAEHFETVGREDKKISSKNIGKLWSKTDTTLVNFWIAKFIILTEKAKKK